MDICWADFAVGVVVGVVLLFSVLGAIRLAIREKEERGA